MTHPYWPLFDLRVRTPRVELRPGNDDDLTALARLAREGIHDPEFMPFLQPWTRQAGLERETLKWHWRQRAEWSPGSWCLGFVVLAGGEVVGTQDLRGTDFAVTRTVSSGSWLGRRHQGQGLGKEMRAAMLHFAFAGLGAEVARSSAFFDNAPSIAVSRALGYEGDGIDVLNRGGEPVTSVRFRLGREAWEKTRREDITIEGLDPCLALFGL
jgi:RimJ/RimL family protein N-acetyltransferase